MKSYFWTIESWGAEYPPENAGEIIDKANELIEAYAAENDNPEDDDIVRNYSDKLWERYCETGNI